jgi:AraC-like DNA-binding protein
MAVHALAAAVEGVGVERARFLAEAGLAAALLEDSNARISLADYNRALRAALSTSGDPALGLRMGGQASTAKFDVLASLAEHSGCLREALQVSARYARIVMDGPRLELCEEGDIASVRCTPLCGEAPEVRLTAEFVMSSLQYLIRRFVGSAVQVRRVLFAYQAPAHRAEYTRIFEGREQFAQAFTGIEIERAWLDRAHAYRSPELRTLLQSRAELLLARVEQDAPAAERVKRWLAAQSLEIKPTMDTIARALGMSARSLRRRLHDEGAPYDDLVEDARALRAKSMLADPRLSIQETAYALGFVTPASFSRAFKRWTGMAPSAYRAEH